MLNGCLWLRKSAPKRKNLEKGIQNSLEKVWLQPTGWRRSWLGAHTKQGHSHRASRKTTSGRWTSWGRWAGGQVCRETWDFAAGARLRSHRVCVWRSPGNCLEEQVGRAAGSAQRVRDAARTGSWKGLL